MRPVSSGWRPTRRDEPRGERGAIAIEFMLVISMLIVVFMLMLQYAVRAHAERIAAAAAEEGLAAATSYDGTPGDGERVAAGYLTKLGPGLHDTTVDATRDATSATVTVGGAVDQLIPFLSVRVHVRVEGPVERFVPESTQLPSGGSR